MIFCFCNLRIVIKCFENFSPNKIANHHLSNIFYQGFVAYESVNLPSFYIRHSGKDEQRLKVDKDDNSDQFKKDASWKTVQTEGYLKS